MSLAQARHTLQGLRKDIINQYAPRHCPQLNARLQAIRDTHLPPTHKEAITGALIPYDAYMSQLLWEALCSPYSIDDPRAYFTKGIHALLEEVKRRVPAADSTDELDKAVMALMDFHDDVLRFWGVL